VRRLLVLAAVAAVAIGTSACTAWPAPATVNGQAISRSTLDAQLHALETSPQAACVFAAEIDPAAGSVQGAGQGTVSSSVAASELDDLVLEQLLAQNLAAHHQVLTAADVQAAREDLAGDVDNTLLADEQSGAVPPACADLTSNPVGNLPAAFGRQISRFLALQEQFRARVGRVDISAAGIASYYAQHLADFKEACLDLVVADSQAAASAIDGAIAGGESFAAASVGTGADTQITPPGGQVACQLPSVLTSTFGASDTAQIYAASPGQLLAPLAWTDPSTGGSYWLAVKVTSLPEAPLADVASDIRQQLLSGTDSAATAALTALVQRAVVTVDPRYGSWHGKVGLLPPTAPPAATVLNPAANQASGSSGLP
jgi:hypothetical protein